MGFVKNFTDPGHAAGFSGKTVISRYSKISKKKLDGKLARIPTYVLHREAKRPKIYNPFIIYRKRDLLQADLIDMQSRSQDNGGIKYILIVCDTLTRKCWAEPLLNKTSKLVLEKFKDIFRKTGKFERFMTDAGSEFVSRQFQSFLAENNIAFVRGNPHAPHVERLNRTIQGKIFRYMTENESKKWAQVLGDILEGYNNRRHRIIKMSPNEAEDPENYDQLLFNLRLYYDKALMRRKSPEFKIGDTVSIQKQRGVFAKGYSQVFSDELFKIREIHDKLPIPMYSISSYDGKEDIRGRFYSNELSLANFDVFKVEKILNTRTNSRGEEEVRVKWKGWPSRYNQWIKKSDVARDY